jgi:DNA (cytosine-5)-methyltransferase 1
MFKFIDLFCGIGGFSLGFIQAGFEHKFGLDNCNDTPQIEKVYRDNIGEFINKDIKNFSGKAFESEIDVVIGSPPCKSFSVANTLNRKCDTSLTKEFLRVVDEIKPKVWIMENVPSFLKFVDAPFKHKFNANDFGCIQTRVRGFASNIELKPEFAKKQFLNEKQTFVASHYLFHRNAIFIFNTVTSHMASKQNYGGNYIAEKDKGLRELTTEEGLIVQSFPGWYKTSGIRTVDGKMIGNAVPPLMSYKIAMFVKQYLEVKS